MFSHAYVRYLEDKRCALVDTTDIRDFDKWDHQDIDEKRIKAATHWVNWVFKDGSSDYFPAEILHLGASEAEVQKKVKKGRLKFRRMMPGEEQEWNCDEEPQEKEQEENKRKGKKRKEPNDNLLKLLDRKKRQMDVAKTRHNCDGNCSAAQELERMKDVVDRKEEEIKKLRKLNEKLQEKVIMQMERFIESANGTVAHSMVQPTVVVPPSTPPPAQGPEEKNGAAAARAFCSPAAITQQSTPESRGPDDMVDIGQGLKIPTGAWQRIQLQPKDSLFVKELLVAIWDPADLKGRSLQGKRSPRFPDRPIKEPLTPWKVSVMRECYKERLLRLGLPAEILQNSLKRLNHFVVEKLADIEKLAKKTEMA
ncbi:BEN domain-containing protein 5 isoform X2 [Rhipicephalus sanguineus]|uniref:BEN domain-containing protein 5 isoform X2 n=1 Tax=Rhipicephalus sanguineus TaxID=34632 RepID=UPI001894589A|nr:BEN domain-containing protein 5 isoform X2 [Rhipicephalus sanguineus]